MLRVLVTGAGGFIGSRVCERLESSGHQVVRSESGDSPARGFVEHVASGEFGGVVHLAAIVDTRVPASAKLRDVNIDLTVELAAAASSSGATFVFASSASVYGDALPGEPLTIGDERSRLRCTGPLSPYARSKLDAERLMRQANPSALALRLSNVYGPGDEAKGEMRCVATRMMERHARGLELAIFDDSLDANRDYVHVDVVVEAVVAGLNGAGPGSVLNCGSGEAVSFDGLLSLLATWSDRHPDVTLVANPHSAQYQYWTKLEMGSALKTLGLPSGGTAVERLRQEYTRIATVGIQ